MPRLNKQKAQARHTLRARSPKGGEHALVLGAQGKRRETRVCISHAPLAMYVLAHALRRVPAQPPSSNMTKSHVPREQETSLPIASLMKIRIDGKGGGRERGERGKFGIGQIEMESCSDASWYGSLLNLVGSTNCFFYDHPCLSAYSNIHMFAFLYLV